MRFIYVFGEKERDELLRQGFSMIHEDLEKQVYVFENRGVLTFAAPDASYVLTDVLTF